MYEPDNQMIKYVELRLQEWRYHYSRIQDGALGYHSRSTIAAWREGYTLDNRQTGPRSFEVNEGADEIESIVNALHRFNERLAIALRCHYFSRERNLRDQAVEMDISHSQFRAYINLAKMWVTSRLSIIKNGYEYLGE